MSSSCILPRLIIILVCAVIGASIGTAMQALRITGRSQEFRSQAKLVAGGQMVFNDNVCWPERQADFYGTIIETLESAEMKRRGLERVRALNPDLKVSDVAIRVAQTKGSSIFNILATGTEPKYTKIFLDALLDEFIAFRMAIREQSQGKALQQFFQEVASRQNQMEKSLRALEEVRSRLESLSAKTDQERLVARLNALRNQRDDLRFELKSKKEGDPDQASLQTNISTLELKIQITEAELQRFEPRFSELRMLAEKYATDKGVFAKLFEMENRWESAFKSVPENVAIQERASPSSEHVEDWTLPIAVGAGGGGLLGGLIGLALSQLIVRSSKPPQIPAAVG
ncbi:MAG: hypothetical protein B7Z37_15160 [Verrucomicrobia bacterium 12-59-8]|nr:MAG: hypothetical protein B7Z37_15160 [Verrucomicrobia bacterium 12-59-8]